jgi:ubiquinone/menaquinone biosynthesis C-methylase UbiE
MSYDRERPSFEAANNVTVQRCFFAYEFAAKNYIKGKTVADIGCGNGYGTVYMSQFAEKATGLDYSQETIKQSNEENKDKKNLNFVSCKVPPICLPDNYADVVTSFQFIEHIHERAEFIKDVKRILKPGGVFICSTPNIKKSIARNPFHVHEYTFDEMRAEVGKVFDDFELMGLQGNEAVNKYYADNNRFVQKIIKWDIFGLHKILPATLLIKPYNFLTTWMRGKLADENKSTTAITTADFFLDKQNLDDTWDIYFVARKKA